LFRFFREHTDDIVSFDLSKDGTKAVTGEVGAKPSIYVWDVHSL
jgi:hypothetical protein